MLFAALLVLWWALSLGACLGGNGSPIGAKVTAFTLLVSSVFLAGYVALGPSEVAWAGGGVLAVALLALWRYEVAMSRR